MADNKQQNRNQPQGKKEEVKPSEKPAEKKENPVQSGAPSAMGAGEKAIVSPAPAAAQSQAPKKKSALHESIPAKYRKFNN